LSTLDARVVQTSPSLVLDSAQGLRRFRELIDRDRMLYEALAHAGITAKPVVEGDVREAQAITCLPGQCELIDAANGNRVVLYGNEARRFESLGAKRISCYSGVDFHVHGVVWRCTVFH
jgi:hypothetical protein